MFTDQAEQEVYLTPQQGQGTQEKERKIKVKMCNRAVEKKERWPGI